jgi:hypothetical protein
MKNILLAVLCLSLAAPLMAQTTAMPPSNPASLFGSNAPVSTDTTVGNGSILTSPGQLLLGIFEDPTNYFGTNSLRVGLIGLKTGSTYGAACDIHVPLLTNGQISAGVAVADIGNTLYNAALNINLEKTIYPLKMFGVATNFAVSVFAESGPDVIVKSGSIGSQTFGGLNYCTKLGPGHLSLVGVLGNISQLPKKCWGAGLEYSLHIGALGL